MHTTLLIHFAQEYHRRRRCPHGVPCLVIRRPSSYASKRHIVLLDRQQCALLPRTCGAGTWALHPILTPPRHEVNPIGHDLMLAPFLAVLPVPTAPLQAPFNERGTPFLEIFTGRFRLATKRDHIDKADVFPPCRRAVLPPPPVLLDPARGVFTARPKDTTGVPRGVKRRSGSRVRLPSKMTLLKWAIRPLSAYAHAQYAHVASLSSSVMCQTSPRRGPHGRHDDPHQDGAARPGRPRLPRRHPSTRPHVPRGRADAP